MTESNQKLPTRFDPKPAEARWYGEWLARDLFRARHDDARPRFSIVIPPPNVTGYLHLGHALNNTLQDVLARHKRIQGYNVLWLPGTDHAGIATQVVVERQLAEKGQTRHELGREAFVDAVWKWKEHSGSKIIEQLKALGSSCDWSRERFTLDAGLSKAVRTAFVRLHQEGLIYRGESLVNWCSRCATVLSDLESPYQPEAGKLYSIRYPLKNTNECIEVATTRPETMLGDTAVAVHPDDERYQNWIGQTLRLPLTQREIPVVADTFVDREFGSGAVKITPGHDLHDFECAQRLGLPRINILHSDGHLNENAGSYAGLTVPEARKRVVADLEAQGFLVGVKDHPHEVPHCDRCKTVVEPLLSEQWFLDMEPLAKKAIAAVRDERTKFYPKSWEKTYFHWLENIRPWTLSRQLWWGHRIPAWRCTACQKWTVSVEDPSQCTHCGDTRLTQEVDVLDTWFSSGLWPFSTMGWPDDTEDFRAFYPTSVLSTGFDIIFFWVARMMMLGLHFTEEVPFRDVYIHPLIRDAHGEKMSKSKGNVIDPLEMIDVHGTDALRLTLASLAIQGRDIKLSEEKITSSRAFITKLWNAARFALLNLEDYDANAASTDGGLYDRWIRVRLSHALEESHRALTEYRFSDAVGALYQFVWKEFCDWYIELAKQTLQGSDTAARRATQRTLVEVLHGTLLGLHPYIPFVTEEIANALPLSDQHKKELLLEQSYPAASAPLSAEEAAEMDTLVAFIVSIRQIRGELGVPQRNRVRVTFPTALRDLVEKHRAGIASLTLAGEIVFSDGAVSETAALSIAAGHRIAVEFNDSNFLAEEIPRLEKTLQKLEADLAQVAKKLGNPSFIERAKPEVVAGEQEKHARFTQESDEIRERLTRLQRLVRPK